MNESFQCSMLGRWTDIIDKRNRFMEKSIVLGYVHMSSYRKNGRLYPDYFKEEESGLKEINDNSPDEVILPPDEEYTLIIDYPLNIPFMTKLESGEKGMTRRQVVEFVIGCYKRIYKEEDGTTKVKAGLIPGMVNRNETNGKYGIWGHGISDLILHTLYVDGNKLSISCDS